jgi:hypothetical protein
MLSAISKWKKRNIAPPLLITIDDTRLWLRQVGELMPSSEIQSVKISGWGEGRLHYCVEAYAFKSTSTIEITMERCGSSSASTERYGRTGSSAVR